MRPAVTAYLENMPGPAADLFEPFRAYVRRLAESNHPLHDETKLELRFLVEGLHGGDFLIRCDAGELTLERTEGRPAPCTVFLNALWLHQILTGSLSWSDFFQSLRFSVEQDPEAEDDHLLAWLALVTPRPLPLPDAALAIEKPAHA